LLAVNTSLGGSNCHSSALEEQVKGEALKDNQVEDVNMETVQ